jgi:hypothetical protein
VDGAVAGVDAAVEGIEGVDGVCGLGEAGGIGGEWHVGWLRVVRWFEDRGMMVFGVGRGDKEFFPREDGEGLTQRSEGAKGGGRGDGLD